MPKITIDVTPAQAKTICKALGEVWNLEDSDKNPREANAAEVEDYLKLRLKQVVENARRDRARKVAAAQDVEFDL